MKTILKLLSNVSLCAVAFLAYGCSSITPIGGATAPPVSVDKVEVLYQEPARPYDVIALVSYQGTAFATVPGVVEKCRQTAAKAGADALIVTSTTRAYATASGKAIKWKK
jgi:Mg2+/citrate symporter